MTIKCANCKTSVTVPEDQYGKPCECPGCKALLLIPRKKGRGADDAAVEVEAKSFEDLKQELLDAVRPELEKLQSGPDLEEVARRVSESLRPEIEKLVAARSAAVASGIDTAALKEQLQAEVLKEVKANIQSAPAMDASSTAAFAKMIEALGEKLASGAAPGAPARAPEEQAPPRKAPRRPFAQRRQELALPNSPEEAYPEVETEEPDVERVIDLNAGEDENLRAFLNEIAGIEGKLVMFEPTQSVIDVGNWRKRKVWMAVTNEKIVLAAYGRRTFQQEISLEEVGESFWNEFTSEVVFVPFQAGESGLRSIKLTEDRGYHLLGLIHHGIPA